MFNYRITLYGGMAGRIESDEVDLTQLCEGQTPRFGFYWWFWVPQLQVNGGIFKKNEVVDCNFKWLRFSASITFWPLKSKVSDEKEPVITQALNK